MGHSSTGSSTLEFAAKKLAILKTSSFVVCKDILGDIQWGHLVIMVLNYFIKRFQFSEWPCWAIRKTLW
jgi:hypothetical protein